MTITNFVLGLILSSVVLAGCTAQNPEPQLSVAEPGGEWRKIDLSPAQKGVLNEACYPLPVGGPTESCLKHTLAIKRSSENAEAYRDLPLSSVEQLADGGDKTAQYEFGKRLLSGNGIERDLERAERYLKNAATSETGQRSFYTPGVGNSPSSITNVASGTRIQGIEEAEVLLGGLRSGEFE